QHTADGQREQIALNLRKLVDADTAKGAGQNIRRRRQAHRSERIFEASAEGLREPGERSVLLRQRLAVDALEEHAVSGSYASAAVAEDIPRDTDAGTEVVVVVLGQSARHVTREQNSGRRVGDDGGTHAIVDRIQRTETRIDRVDAVVLFDPGQEWL